MLSAVVEAGAGSLPRNHAVIVGPRSASDSLETVGALFSMDVGRCGPVHIVASASSLDPATWSALRSPPDGFAVTIVGEIAGVGSLLGFLRDLIAPADTVVLLRPGDRLNEAAFVEAALAFARDGSVSLGVVGALVDEAEDIDEIPGGPLALIGALSGDLPISAFLFRGRSLLERGANALPHERSAIGPALMMSFLDRPADVARFRTGRLHTGYRAWRDAMGVDPVKARAFWRESRTVRAAKRIMTEVEHHAMPRFAVIDLAGDTVRLASDVSAEARVLSVDQFAERLARLAMFGAADVCVPEHLVFVTGRSAAAIADSRLWAWLMNDVARILRASMASTYVLRPTAAHILVAAAEMEVEQAPLPERSLFDVQDELQDEPQDEPQDEMEPAEAVPAGSAPAEPDIVALKTNLLLEVAVKGEITWFSGQFRDAAASGIVRTCVATPFFSTEPDPSLPAAGSDSVRVEVNRMAVRLRRQLPAALAERDVPSGARRIGHLHAPHALMSLLGQREDHVSLIVARDRLRVVFALPIVSFGGVERVTIRVAERLRRLGVHTTLLVFDAQAIWSAREAVAAFDEIFFVGRPDVPRENLWAHGEAWRRAVAFASAGDVLVVSHVHDWSALIKPLRDANVAIVPYLHLTSYARDGGSVGQPYVAAEGLTGADGVIVISEQLSQWCAGQGFAQDRTLLVRNSSSHAFDPVAVAAARRQRQVRSADEPLRVLYIGRLDAEKGLARLSEIAREIDAMAPDVEFRIVGASVVGGDLSDEITARLHPPTFDTAEIAAHFTWADVLVITSVSEGIPLTILEAMHFGVVPVSTRVGAIAEVVADDVDGYLVDPDAASVAGAMLQKLSILRDDRFRLKRMATKAIDRDTGEAGWDRTGEAVHAFLANIVATRRAATE